MDLKAFDRIIMGIDPGTNVMGYGILGVRANKPEVIVMGVIERSKFAGKNVQSMLKLGRAQGVAMAAVLTRDIPVSEYAPRSVKMAVTGNGQASKEQVSNMLRHLLHIPADQIPGPLDATDALAVALTHYYETGKPAVAKGPKSWADFIAKNPDRLAPRRRADDK